ncbi:anti-anti-sigma factor [Streptomyces solincola]|uniref:Anti-anti-sigma factor n=1 Tax=Streptomyces solincola TaxID=2100817 RepID=A0A2S9Q379_9ACTN|nr:STAS domain-containing protein [Streptomyces solincola]PRH81063.1 anti-anti-sigma factor [Streptomyces solincola]
MDDDQESTVIGERAGAAYVVRVPAEADHELAPDLQTVLDAALDTEAERTVVDLSRTDFADSTMLHVLLAAQRAHRGRGRPMVVAGPFGHTVHRLFEVTGTAGFFELAETTHAATGAADRDR